MPLVAYPDSDLSSSDDNSKQNIVQAKGLETKRKRRPSSEEGEQPSNLPPLPDSFHDLYSSTARASNQDDPSLHAGRQRQIPHVLGQWPTHVYIEWHPSRSETNLLTKALADVRKTLAPHIQLHSLLTSDLGAALPLHISLSRTLMLATDQRQLFTESLPTAIEESGVKPFTMTADDLRWVANYEGNRWFLIVHVKKPPGDPMNKLLRASNRVAQNLNQPRLYVRQASSAAPVAMHKRHSPLKKHRGSQPSFSSSKGYVEGQDSRAYEDMSDHFHISIGWTLEDPRDHSGMDSMGIGSQGPMKLELVIETVKAKIGNAIVVVPLGSKAAETNGIVGL